MQSAAGECFGLVVAAGRGTRFGGLKQFALLGGRPLLSWSLNAFEQSKSVVGVVVVTNRPKIPFVHTLVQRSGFGKVLAIAPGGRTRSVSVRNGLASLPAHGLVAVHDAARPFVNAQMLDQGLAKCIRRGAVTYGYPLSDAVKRVFRGRITETVARRGLYAVQTPQFFRLELLRRAHANSRGTDAPDDCALVESLGYRPLVIPGPLTNFKITSRADLALARRLL